MSEPYSPIHPHLLGLRRRLPRAPRLDRAGFVALALTIAGLPFDEGPKLLFTAPLGATLVLTVLRGVRLGRWPISIGPVAGRFLRLGWPIVLLGIWATASLLWAESPRHTRSLLWRDLGRGVMVMLLVAQYVRGVGRLRLVTAAFAFGVGVCGVTGIVERLSYLDVERYRVFGTFGHPNHCANLMGAGLAVLAALPRLGRADIVFRVVIMVPAAVTLFFTLSRGAWFGTMVALGVVGLLRNRRLIFAAIGMLAAVVVVALVAPDGYLGERVRDLFERDRFVKALHHRPQIWSAAWVMVKERPLHGHGYGYKNFHVAWERHEFMRGELYNAAHNTPLHVAFELGAIGLALHAWLYLLLMATVIRGYRATADPWVRGLLAGLLGISVGWSLQAFTVEHILLEQMMSIIGFVAGLVVAAARVGPGRSVDAPTPIGG